MARDILVDDKTFEEVSIRSVASQRVGRVLVFVALKICFH